MRSDYSLPTWTTSLEWHACAEGGRVPGDDEQRLALLPQLDPLGHRRRRLRRLRLLGPRGQVRHGRHRGRRARVGRVPLHDTLAPAIPFSFLLK